MKAIYFTFLLFFIFIYFDFVYVFYILPVFIESVAVWHLIVHISVCCCVVLWCGFTAQQFAPVVLMKLTLILDNEV